MMSELVYFVRTHFQRSENGLMQVLLLNALSFFALLLLKIVLVVAPELGIARFVVCLSAAAMGTVNTLLGACILFRHPVGLVAAAHFGAGSRAPFRKPALRGAISIGGLGRGAFVFALIQFSSILPRHYCKPFGLFRQLVCCYGGGSHASPTVFLLSFSFGSS